MKKNIIILLALICTLWCKAQTITAAEYFIDNDPGAGNAIPVSISAGSSISFSANFSTSAMTNGFHLVGLRTMDNAGHWGLYEKTAFFISQASADVTNITAAEYFIDTDPGVGNGVAVPVTAGSTTSFTIAIPTVSLANGFHFISIRTRDAGNKWGLYEKAGFFITQSTANVTNITAAEYFVDNDPGVGNGISLPATTGPTTSFIATVPTAALSAGFHFVAIRAKDADGKWGLYEKSGFYISTSTSNVTNIVAAEYFVDNDPGVGNGTSIPISSGSAVNFVATVPVTALATGFHFVAIRTKDAEGKWGLYEKGGFYISGAATGTGTMTAAEYFIDTDPGVGNGTPFTIPGGTSFAQNFILNIPAGTSDGTHFLAVRVKNGWGLFDFDTITVAGLLPLHLLDFEGYRRQQSVELLWKTTDEQNTSHFEIERSSNGTIFQKIGTVQSQNAPGTHTYHFNDDRPVKGVNFYRLKQVDLDGRVTYSKIIRILFDSYGTPVTIYPNPATDVINIDFGGRQKTVLVNIYDALGKQVAATSLANQSPLRIPVDKLAKGKYFVQLSDGETVQTGNFVN